MTLADHGAAPSTDVVVVRPMTVDDVAFAAALHETALPHGFFGRLGPRFLACYYQSFIDSPHAVAFIAQGPTGPIGVIVGTVRNSAHYSWVLRRRGRMLTLRAAAWLVTHPPHLWFFLRTRLGWYLGGLLRFGRRAVARGLRGGAERAGPAQPAVLTHLAVTPFGRGAGVGASLVEQFLTAARLAGCQEAVLVTFAGPEGAGPFYRRLGWTCRDEHHDHDGRMVACYDRRL